MGIFNFLDPVLDAIFGPVTAFNPTLGLILIVFFVSLLITLSYKFMTNQTLMKDLKDEINDLQKELKKLSKNPEKALKVQNEMMETNMKYMMHSMRSTLATFIPIIIIFGWLSANIAFLPIGPGEEFKVDIHFTSDDVSAVSLSLPPGLSIVDNTSTKEVVKKAASFTVKAGKEGTYPMTFLFDSGNVTKSVKITTEHDYLKPTMRKKGFTDFIYEADAEYVPKELPVNRIQIQNLPFKANLLGFRLGWFGTYFIFALVFSMLLRKIFKVY